MASYHVEEKRNVSQYQCRTSAKIFVRASVQAGFFSIGCKLVAKKALSTSVEGAGALVQLSSPVSFAADLAQGGLEVLGYKKAGQAVGLVGNVAGGVLLGGIAGPPGAVLGALGGFCVWVLGEAAGRVAEKIMT